MEGTKDIKLPSHDYDCNVPWSISFPTSLKCYNDILKRINSGGRLDILKIKTSLGYIALSNKRISDFGKIRSRGKKS